MWLLISHRKAKNWTSADVIFFFFLGSLMIYVGKSKALTLTSCTLLILSMSLILSLKKKKRKKTNPTMNDSVLLQFNNNVLLFGRTYTNELVLCLENIQVLRIKNWGNIHHSGHTTINTSHFQIQQSHLNTVHYLLIQIDGIDAAHSCTSMEMHTCMCSTVLTQHPTGLLYLMILLGFPLQTNLQGVATWPF